MTTFFLTPRRVDISLLDAGHGGIKEKFIDNIPPPGESGLLFGHLKKKEKFDKKIVS